MWMKGSCRIILVGAVVGDMNGSTPITNFSLSFSQFSILAPLILQLRVSLSQLPIAL